MEFQFTKGFDEDACDFCGECFHQCPVMGVPLEKAKREIRSLVETGKSEVLERCTGCMACNSICPKGANPHTLIVTAWRKRYDAEGIPARGGLVLPYRKPNLYTLTMAKLPEDEGALVKEWEDNWRNPPHAETMMYAGCNILLQPSLLDSGLYKDVPIFGSTEICCGEPLYRMGCWDAEKAVAEHVKEEFARMGFKRLIMPCLAGYHLFKHVYPDVFDVELDIEAVPIVDWLHDRIVRGDVEIMPLGKTAVLHDNCWPKASGDRLFDKTRELLGLLGVEVVEPRHTRAEALCCGMCAAAARFSLMDIVRTARTRWQEFEETDADMVVDYCGGCNWLFALANRLSFSRVSLPLYHLLEVVQTAAGETPKHRTHERTGRIIRTMAGRLAGSYLTRRRFWIDEIQGRPVRSRG